MKQYVKKYGKIKKCMSKKEKHADKESMEAFVCFFLRTEFEANENLTGKKSANQTRKQSLYIAIQMTCKVQIIMWKSKFNTFSPKRST